MEQQFAGKLLIWQPEKILKMKYRGLIALAEIIHELKHLNIISNGAQCDRDYHWYVPGAGTRQGSTPSFR